MLRCTCDVCMYTGVYTGIHMYKLAVGSLHHFHRAEIIMRGFGARAGEKRQRRCDPETDESERTSYSPCMPCGKTEIPVKF